MNFINISINCADIIDTIISCVDALMLTAFMTIKLGIYNDKKKYIYTEKDIVKRFFAKNRKSLLREAGSIENS